MVRTEDEVLTREEKKKLQRYYRQLKNPQEAKILENVMHIECIPKKSRVFVRTFVSLRSPYDLILPRHSHKATEAPERPDEMDLFDRRRKHKELYDVRRHEYLLDELRIRTEDILAHKWYLSEKMSEELDEPDYDSGIFIAAAHWLKEEADKFYKLSEDQHTAAGSDFEWEAMERAVVISGVTKRGKESLYVIVKQKDLICEENAAQLAGGVIDHDSRELNLDRAQQAREKFSKMHTTKHFCILKSYKK
jgi:hypothetical protein